MQKTNYAIFAIVVALAAFILVRERFSLSTGDTRERSARVVPGLVRERLDAIEVVRGGERYRLESNGRDRDGNPRFRFSAPTRADADTDLVLSAISAAEWGDPLRVLENVDARARRRYGLDHPRVTVRFEVADATFVLSFGGREERGLGVYAEADGRYFVVSDELLQAFDQPASHFRVRRIAAALPAEPTRLVVHSSHADAELVHDARGWRMVSPYAAVASEGRVNVVLAFMRTLEATRFVDEAPTDLGRYGLATPSMRLLVEGAAETMQLLVGSACPSGGEPSAGPELHARVGNGPVVCISATEIAPLDVDVRAYLETRASLTESGGVVGFDLHERDATLSVRDEDGAFQFELGAQRGVADPEAVEEWLEAVRNTRASSIAPVPATFAPTVTLTVHRHGGRADDVIVFAREADGSILGRRGTDPLVLRFPSALAPRLAVTTTHVRDRALLHEDPSNVEEITIDRASGREAVRRGEGSELAIVEPSGMPVDAARVLDLSMRLAGLEAVRFVSDSPRPEFGLDSPRFVVRFVFRNPAGVGATSRHRLSVGAPVGDGSGGAYATLDESPAVFVLVGATLELIESPLVDRGSLATESLFIDGLEISAGGRTVRLARDGDHFTLDGAPIDDARANAAIHAVADLRAVSVLGYGAAAARFGITTSRTEIRIQRDAASAAPRDVVLRIGGPVGEADAPSTGFAPADADTDEQPSADAAGNETVRLAVQRVDLGVTYVVESASLAAIVALAR